MKLAGSILLVIVILAVGVARALPYRGTAGSGTRAFTIDGRRFHVEDAESVGLSLIKRELQGRGLDIPCAPDVLESVLEHRAVEQLREEPARSGAPPLPRGIEPDHAIRLETATGPIDILFGRVVSTDGDVLGRLRSSGWNCRESGPREAPGAIAHIAGQKEVSVVLLEKNERRFLAFRRAVR